MPGLHDEFISIHICLLTCVALLFAGSAAVAQPQIDLSAVTAAANAAFGETLSPAFTYYANDITGLLSAFIFEDVGVTAYNGAAPLITSKALLAPAVGIGLVEGYHAGIVSTLFLLHPLLHLCKMQRMHLLWCCPCLFGAAHVCIQTSLSGWCCFLHELDAAMASACSNLCV